MRRERETARARLPQQGAGLVGVVAVPIVPIGVAVAADRARGVQRLGGTGEDVLHDRLAVDRVVERLAHALVPERVLLRVEVEPDDARGGRRRDVQRGDPGQARRLLGRHVEDEVDVAALQRQHPRTLIGVGPAHDRAQLRLAAPVLLVGFQAHLLPALVVDELEGAGADRRRVQVVVADLLDLRGAVDDDPVVAERVDERRERRLGRDLEDVLAGDLQRLHHRQRRLADRVLAEALEVDAHRLGVERRAIGEFHVLTRVKRPRPPVLRLLPRLDEPRHHLAVAGQPHQRLRDLVQDAAVVQPGGLVGVEDRDVGRHPDDQGVLGRRRGADDDQQQHARQRDHQPSHLGLRHAAPLALHAITQPPLGCRTWPVR